MPLAKEVKITILSLLKNFYDEQIFAILIKDFYDSDLDVSLAAINASASLGNEVAVPHLYRMLEKGKPQQQLAAIQTLASINAPSAIEQLAKYFAILTAASVRKEILKAINRISPMHPKARELNRAVLADPAMAREYYESILSGLLDSGDPADRDLVKNHLLRAPPDVQRVLFYKLLTAAESEASEVLQFFQDKTAQFDPNTLGCYLCAYELKTASPQPGFVSDLLSGADPRTVTSFLISLTNYNGRIPDPNRIFRLLLRIPYVDQDTEGLTGSFISKIVAEIRYHTPHLLNEFVFTTAANLEAVFSKIKKQHISLRGIKEREALLAVVLAKILEQYAAADLLAEAQNFFKSERPEDPAALTARIKERLISAPEDEQNRFEACLPLFSNPDRLVRLGVSHTLAKANPSNPALLRRLNRLIRVVGILDVRTSAKKVTEVLAFAREERIPFLEESSVVTLCQLMSRAAIEQAKVIFTQYAKFPHSLHGFIRGARYVPAEYFINPLLKLLLVPVLPPKSRALIVDSLKNMNLQGIKGFLPALIQAMRLAGLERSLLFDLSGVVSKYGDASIVQPLLDLTGSMEPVVSQTGIRTLRNLAKRESSLPRDVLTNRLYLLLEHKLKSIQVESLLTLIALQDDLAIQILDDYVKSKDEAAIVEILANLEKPLSHDMISFLLQLLLLDSVAVQRELRRVLPDFCQGVEGEEIRRALLDALKGRLVTASAPAPPPEEAEGGLIAHAKLDFKFRRESAQELTVLFTDVVGYTEKTSSTTSLNIMGLVEAFEKITLPTIAAFKGELIKKMGDGLLAVFKHPLNAASAALEIQKAIREYNAYRTDAEKFYVRIGLNTGTVIRKDSDIFGDTVNVASRMQTLANPGSILLTNSTYEEIKESVRCTQLGDYPVKGKGVIPTYSAEELLIDSKQFLADSKGGGSQQAAAGGKRIPADLQESMFEPVFQPPAGVQIEGRLLRSLQGLFKDFTKVTSDLAKDHHEEYLLKRYLQDKWNELFPV